MSDLSPLSQGMLNNVDGDLKLATAQHRAGVKISDTKVQGMVFELRAALNQEDRNSVANYLEGNLNRPRLANLVRMGRVDRQAIMEVIQGRQATVQMPQAGTGETRGAPQQREVSVPIPTQAQSKGSAPTVGPRPAPAQDPSTAQVQAKSSSGVKSGSIDIGAGTHYKVPR